MTTVESETPFASAIPRDKKVKNTHHRQSRANSRSCRAYRRPCPPPHRRPACRRRCRRARHSVVVSGRCHWSLLCVHHQTLGPRSASCQHCSMRSAGVSPRRCARLRPTVERLADGVQLAQSLAGQGARAGSNGLVRWETICPAGQWCLHHDVSMRSCRCRVP